VCAQSLVITTPTHTHTHTHTHTYIHAHMHTHMHTHTHTHTIHTHYPSSAHAILFNACVMAHVRARYACALVSTQVCKESQCGRKSAGKARFVLILLLPNAYCKGSKSLINLQKDRSSVAVLTICSIQSHSHIVDDSVFCSSASQHSAQLPLDFLHTS